MAPRGSKIGPAFGKFLRSKDPNDCSEQALLRELKALDKHLMAYVCLCKLYHKLVQSVHDLALMSHGGRVLMSPERR